METNINKIGTGNGTQAQLTSKEQKESIKRAERAEKFQRRAAWPILASMNLCGWYLLLGPIDVCSTADTRMSYFVAMAAYITAAVLLVVVSLIWAVRLLPEDFFDE